MYDSVELCQYGVFHKISQRIVVIFFYIISLLTWLTIQNI